MVNHRRSRKSTDHQEEDDLFDEHIIPLEALCERYGTDPVHGLTEEKAKIVLARNGKNVLTPPKRPSELLRFLKNIFQGFSLLLWIGAMLCFVAVVIQYVTGSDLDMDNIYLGFVLILVVLITGVFSFYQEGKSSKIMESFKNMIPLNATVIREGVNQSISTELVVVGDVVILKSGDRIPADLVITESYNLKVDNSSLTGESEPQGRTKDNTSTDPLHSKNVAFFSTNAVEGSGRGIVVRTGDKTIMGKIAGLATGTKVVDTPLRKEIKIFMRFISLWACFLGVTFSITAICIGYSWLDSIIFLIGIIVSNVPEGLLATVTVSLTLTSKRLAAKNCLVKKLEAVESLGSTTMICSDKTGTLTQNKMTVVHMFFNDNVVGVYQGGKILKKNIPTYCFYAFSRCAMLCNEAVFKEHRSREPVMKREVIGDASETAILRCMEIATQGRVRYYRSLEPMVYLVPFNSKDKYKISIHLSLKNHYVLMMKGAPEIILDRCKTYCNNANPHAPLTDDIKEIIWSAVFELASWGERVLGFCDFDLNIHDYPIGYKFDVDEKNFPTQGLRFIGLIAMIDPPRPNVHDAVMTCKNAGIKVIMVTGDHPVTAESIAKQVGIITDPMLIIVDDDEVYEDVAPKAIVIDGSTLQNMSESELDTVIAKYDEIVFARTSPIQKLLIVESCQRNGAIVAVTGDGVNDSPALKKANIGIAMGITGSDVSKQAADMVLLDDNFSSIVIGVEEGRRIFDNLKKCIAYVLASNVPQITPFLLHMILGIPLPLGVIAILCIDLGTDMWPAISLAYEKAEADIMTRKPRNPKKDRLVSGKLFFFAYGQIGMIEAAAGFYSYFWVMADSGFRPRDLIGIRSDWATPEKNITDSFGQVWNFQERMVLEYTCHTAFFVAIVIVQWADVIICKTRYNSIFQQGMNNWVLNIGLVFETIVAVLLCYVPGSHIVFKTYPLLAVWWLPAIPFALLIFAYDEMRKYFVRKRGFFYRETYY